MKYAERCAKNKLLDLKQQNGTKVTLWKWRQPKKMCGTLVWRIHQTRPESNGLRGSATFYLTSIKSPTSNCWYKSVPMGINTITSSLKRLTRVNQLCEWWKIVHKYKHMSNGKSTFVIRWHSKRNSRKENRHLSNCDLTYVESREEEEKTMSEVLYKVSSKVIKVNISKMDSNLGRIFTDNSFNNCTININFSN